MGQKAELRYKVFAVATVVLAVMISVGICAYFKIDRLSVKPFELPSNVVYAENVDYGSAYLDEISVYGGEILAKGWGVHKGVSNDKYVNLTFLLKSSDEKLYKVSTLNKERSNITTFFNDGFNYDRAGFEARGKIGELPRGKYQAALLIVDADASSLMITYENGGIEW